MSTASELQQALDQAYAAMIEHPHHSLPISYRRAIYQGLTAASDTAAHAQGWLDWLTARYVLPVWQGTWPNDPLLRIVLDLARGMLSRTVAPAAIQIEVVDALDIFSERIDSAEGVTHLDALFAGLAGVQTLQQVVSSYKHLQYATPASADEVAPTWQEQWEYGDWDVAAWAMAAYAGGLGELACEPAKQHSFWQWWLRTAIPQAQNPHYVGEYNQVPLPGLLTQEPTYREDGNLVKTFALADRLGFTFPRSIYDWPGAPGRYYAALLAPQLSALTRADPISLPIPSHRYFDLFVSLAQHRGKPLIVADPKELFIFYPPGGVLCVALSLTTLIATIRRISNEAIVQDTFPSVGNAIGPHFSKELGREVIAALTSTNYAVRYLTLQGMLVAMGVSAAVVDSELSSLHRLDGGTWERLAQMVEPR